ncbi:MAG: preprotein translocase subunit SecE [Neisseriaceae bacterium]|nr:preprotein translocase subunit SecE [Neisseriaceae bacterium]
MKQNKQAKTKNKKVTTNKSVKDFTSELTNKKVKNTKKTPNSNQNTQKISNSDKLKIVLGLIILGLSVWGYYYFKGPNILFPNANSLLSYLCPILGVIAFLLIIIYWCSFGKDIINYIKEATVELRKVVWPDRKTATRMTMLVMFFVFILALFMWISDTFIQWILYDIILRR